MRIYIQTEVIWACYSWESGIQGLNVRTVSSQDWLDSLLRQDALQVWIFIFSQRIAQSNIPSQNSIDRGSSSGPRIFTRTPALLSNGGCHYGETYSNSMMAVLNSRAKVISNSIHETQPCWNEPESLTVSLISRVNQGIFFRRVGEDTDSSSSYIDNAWIVLEMLYLSFPSGYHCARLFHTIPDERKRSIAPTSEEAVRNSLDK